jgi:hypothetical protein
MTRRGRESEKASMDSDINSLAGKWIARLDPNGEARSRSQVIQAWRVAAGPEVFSHARGFALRDGELLVFVDTNSWAMELSALGEHYRAALNIVLGRETVASLRFAVSKKIKEDLAIEAQETAEEAGAAAWKADPVPASDLERDQIRLMSAGIRDAAVRESVISAAIAHLEWRKGIDARNAAEKALQRVRGTNQGAQR